MIVPEGDGIGFGVVTYLRLNELNMGVGVLEITERKVALDFLNTFRDQLIQKS